MKYSFLLLFGLMILMQPAAFAGQESTPAVENGDTVDRVVQKLGKPQGIVSGGRQTIYYYEQGMVYFVTGRVERALLVSVKEAHERTAQRELAELHQRQQEEAERNRLTEAGGVEMARTLADKVFLARPASDRLEYWTQFGKRYPYTDVSAQMAEAREAVVAGQKEQERVNELTALNKRAGEIVERYAQLDADYKASRANWKRTEIDTERAHLKAEQTAMEARIQELVTPR